MQFKHKKKHIKDKLFGTISISSFRKKKQWKKSRKVSLNVLMRRIACNINVDQAPQPTAPREMNHINSVLDDS